MFNRNTHGIPESALVIPALRFAVERKNGEITTSELIKELTNLFQPSGKDAEIIEGRQDTHFSQKVRNLVSHREGERSFIANGYAEYFGPNPGGIRITDAGRALLKQLGG